jgi:hypothetical protein
MIDRHGRALIVGWQPHEILWLRAAMALPFRKRTDAYQQVAEMTTRTLAGVRHRAQLLARADREAARIAPRKVAYAEWAEAVVIDFLPALNSGAKIQAMRAGARAW